MENFTHGVIVINPLLANEEGVPILHFVGYYDEPDSADIEDLKLELGTDESFGLVEMQNAGLLEYYPATPEILEYYIEISQNIPDGVNVREVKHDITDPSNN